MQTPFLRASAPQREAEKRQFNKSKNQQTNKLMVKKSTNIIKGRGRFGRQTASKDLKVKLGAIFTLKINALGPKNSGLVELPNGLTVVVPNTNLGDLVKVKLEKILPTIFPSNQVTHSLFTTNLSNSFFARSSHQNKPTKTKKIIILGSLVQVMQKSLLKLVPNNIEVGKMISLTIKKKGPKNSGLGFTNDFTIIVPNASGFLSETIQVQITKIKSNYAFATLIEKNSVLHNTISSGMNGSTTNVKQMLTSKQNIDRNDVLPLNKLQPLTEVPEETSGTSGTLPLAASDRSLKNELKTAHIVSHTALRAGGEARKQSEVMNLNLRIQKTRNLLSTTETNKLYHIVLPLNTVNFGNFFAFKLNGNLLFVQKSLGVELGDHVLIKLLRIREKFSIAKVEKILQKTMIQSLDFGTTDLVLNKAVFLETMNLTRNTNLKTLSNLSIASNKKQLCLGDYQNRKVKTILQKMVHSSMHYGERTIKCHANMRSYIWFRKKGKNKNRPLLKRGRHIINLFKTYKSFKKVLLLLSKYAANGQTFLFVGTKKSASSLIARAAVLSQTSFFVNSRWLGGMLTNWKTIFQSISQIKPILKEKQKVIQNLLISRQRIKDALLAKVNTLRKKSRKLMFKGKKLIFQLQQNPKSFIEKNQSIYNQKNLMFIQNQNYIEKYSTLSMKEQQILVLMNSFKSNYNRSLEQKKFLKNQILNAKKELSEFKQLFLIGQELAKFKNSILASGKIVLSISYEKFNLDKIKNSEHNKLTLPNPSIEILNQMIAIYYKKFNLTGLFNQSKSSESSQSESIVTGVTGSKNPIILSKLLDKFLIYLPFMKKYLLLSYNRLAQKVQNLRQLNQNIRSIVQKFQTFYSKSLTISTYLKTFKSKLVAQQNFLKILLMKLSILSSEQRLLKFLPKLRYLPTTKNQMYQRVELLMKKFVDPKISYVIDQIYDQKFQSTSKKMAAARKQKWQRLEKYFGGVTQMAKISSKQIHYLVAIIIGQHEEMNAVRECQKLGIKMFTVVDTNCNPKLSDHIIPANDDSSTSIEYILGQMLTYIRLAQKLKRKISSI